MCNKGTVEVKVERSREKVFKSSSLKGVSPNKDERHEPHTLRDIHGGMSFDLVFEERLKVVKK